MQRRASARIISDPFAKSRSICPTSIANGYALVATAPIVVPRIFLSMLMGFFITETLFARFPIMPKTVGTIDDFVEVLMHGLLFNHSAVLVQE